MFRRIRTPIRTCRHCGGEVKDYGGHRKAMNPNGVNLKDVWTDVPPVRHSKFKPGGRTANVLSTKILDRVVEMSTTPGDLVLDPFGGSGTTYAVCERLGRKWIGMEMGAIEPITARLDGSVQPHSNDDYVESCHSGPPSGSARPGNGTCTRGQAPWERRGPRSGRTPRLCVYASLGLRRRISMPSERTPAAEPRPGPRRARQSARGSPAGVA